MRTAGVKDQGLAPSQLVREQAGNPPVPPLRHSRGYARGGFFLRVVIDVEMIGLKDLEVELVVLDLVLAEVPALGGRDRWNRSGQSCTAEDDPSKCRHKYSYVLSAPPDVSFS